MRAQSLVRRQSDVPVRFSLAWTATVAFVLLLTRDSPDPGLFLPVAIVALPFAAAPRHRVAARLLAAVLLLAYLASRGPELGSVLLAPAAGALLLSAYSLTREASRPPVRGARRTRRG